MVEAVFIETGDIKIELRAGPIKSSFPDSVETFVTTANQTKNPMAYETDKVSLVNMGKNLESS